MKTEIIEFKATDGVILNGYINQCDIKTDKVLIQVHGMSGNCFKQREKIISKKISNLNIDTICFNNRGSEIIKYVQKYEKGKKSIILAGTAYEDVEDSYFDIKGAIEFALQMGYTTIYLQGHSLGSTKIVYTYHRLKDENNEMINHIKGIILLSLVDIPDMVNSYLKQEHLEYANRKEKENDILGLMPSQSFIHPISVQTLLKYVKYNKKIDFARYDVDEESFEILNSIKVPLFMRWGNVEEMIKRTAEKQVEFMNSKIQNHHKDIDYIDGANHNYHNKEEILANQIYEFLSKI